MFKLLLLAFILQEILQWLALWLTFRKGRFFSRSVIFPELLALGALATAPLPAIQLIPWIALTILYFAACWVAFAKVSKTLAARHSG